MLVESKPNALLRVCWSEKLELGYDSQLVRWVHDLNRSVIAADKLPESIVARKI